MDKYLMSSPTQVSQHPDMSNEQGNIHIGGLDMFEAQFGDERNMLGQAGVKDRGGAYDGVQRDFEDDSEEVVPVSNNHRSYSMGVNLGDTVDGSAYSGALPLSASSEQFQHSRNISLDDGIYSAQFWSQSADEGRVSHHQSTMSAVSTVSNSQDPPSNNHIEYANPSGSLSSNTVYSGESVPVLSSSVSCQSFAESPSSIKQLASKQYTATPHQKGRNKSFSFSYTNGHTTPLRNGNTASPVSFPNSKVTKTPHSIVKGHSRARSRLSMDLNTPFLSNLSKSNSSQNLATGMVNSFYTNTAFWSPGADLNNLEDIGTPLPTPGSTGNSFSNQSLSTLNHSPTATYKGINSASTSGSRGRLHRADTLDSIKIEDQENDAFRQLRKAKSNSNINTASEASKASFGPFVPFQNRINEVPDSSDASLNLHQSYSSSGLYSQTNQPSLQNIYMGSRSFSTNDIHENTGVYSMPNSNSGTQGSFTFSDSVNNSMMSDMLKGNQSDMVSSQSGSRNGNNLTLDVAASKKEYGTMQSSAQFTKSYPASIDLASIAASPMDMSISAPTSANASYIAQQPLNGLLPPMATFSTLQQPQEIYSGQDIETFKGPIPNDIKFPVKLADTANIIDPKKKHQCSLCNARFQRPEHVKRHMKSHSSEKPFECDEPKCGKRFNRKDNLKAHLKKIHGRKL